MRAICDPTNEMERGIEEDLPEIEERIQYYHIDEDRETLYEATENEDGTWTVFNQAGESQICSTEEFNKNFMVYQDTERDAIAAGDQLLGIKADRLLDSDDVAVKKTNPGDIQDLSTAMKRIQELEETLAKQQHGTIPQGTTEQKIASSAENLITGIGALGAGLFRGVGKVVETTKDKLIAWQGAQRIKELQESVDAAHDHLDTIKTDPAFKKKMIAIETGVNSKEDVRSELFKRFSSDDVEIQNSKFNLAYHGLLSEMSNLSKFDYETAQGKIDLREKTQGKAATELQQKVEGLLCREEHDVLPDANNENIRAGIENMAKQIQEFIKKLAQKFMPQQRAEEGCGETPSN